MSDHSTLDIPLFLLCIAFARALGGAAPPIPKHLPNAALSFVRRENVIVAVLAITLGDSRGRHAQRVRKRAKRL